MQVQQQPVVTIPVSTLDRLSRVVKTMLFVVEELRAKAQIERFIPSANVLNDAEFEKMSAELQDAFADLSEPELDTLIIEAVTWARQPTSP